MNIRLSRSTKWCCSLTAESKRLCEYFASTEKKTLFLLSPEIQNTALKFLIMLLYLKLTAVLNLDDLAGHSTLASNGLDSFNNLKSLNNLSEDNVLSIQPRSINGTDKKLGSVTIEY